MRDHPKVHSIDVRCAKAAPKSVSSTGPHSRVPVFGILGLVTLAVLQPGAGSAESSVVASSTRLDAGIEESVAAEDRVEEQSWKTGYPLLLAFREEIGKESNGNQRDSLPGFSVVPPGQGGWLLVSKSTSLRVYSPALPKTVKRTRNGLVAMAASVAGGETFHSQKELEKLLVRIGKDTVRPYKITEVRGPERLEGRHDCIRFGVTSRGKKWALGILHPAYLPKAPWVGETTTEVLDCTYPEAATFHAVLVYEEQRDPGSAPTGSASEMEAFFASLEFDGLSPWPTVERKQLEKRVERIDSDARRLWMPMTNKGSVLYVDADGLEQPQSINLGGYPQDLAIGEGAVWVSDQNSVTQIDPATRTRIREIEVGGGLGPITTGGGSVWVLNSVDETVIRIDPTTSEAAQEMTVGESEVHQQQRNILRRYSFRDAAFSELMDLLYWQDTLWIADGGRSVIHRFDPETGQKAGKPIKVGKGPAHLVVAEGDVWSVNFWDGTLSRIDPGSGKVRGKVAACSKPISAVAGPRWIWVTCDGDSSVVRIDPGSMTRVGQPIPGLPSPWGIARTEDSLWVVGYRSKSLARIRLDVFDGPK